MSTPFLKKVILDTDVYAACLQHALTSEKEEIMGLLIGSVNEEQRVSHISACVILTRSDKKPDRVEISPEQLMKSSDFAENLAKSLHQPMRVVGWYHSHPHITVWPSNVDLRTQSTYQMMDPFFVGIIFAVFLKDKNLRNRIEVTCFQSYQSDSGEFLRREIPLTMESVALRSHNLKNMGDLPRVLYEEEDQARCQQKVEEREDIVTKLHNDAVETKALTQILSKVEEPLVEDLTARLATVKNRIEVLRDLKERLLTSQAEL